MRRSPIPTPRVEHDGERENIRSTERQPPCSQAKSPQKLRDD